MTSQDPRLDNPDAQASCSLACGDGERRVTCSKQTRDIMDLKAQKTQVLELLAKQAPAAPAAVSTLLQPQLPYPPSPRRDHGGWDEASQLVQEDMLSIAASGDGASFSSDMQILLWDLTLEGWGLSAADTGLAACRIPCRWRSACWQWKRYGMSVEECLLAVEEIIGKKNVEKNKEAADLPNSEWGTEQSHEPVLEESLQSQAGVSVPPDMEGEGSGTATGFKPGAVQGSSLSEPQQAETEAAVTAVAVLGGGEESGAVEVERAVEELAAGDGGADSEDGAEEMEGELSDSSLISDIPDNQPVNRGEKIILLNKLNSSWRIHKGKEGLKLKTSSQI
ncbi:UNVERIFIED_CONTAM: hypothetical protein FKN15_026667 [Acipenser sinensis]